MHVDIGFTVHVNTYGWANSLEPDQTAPDQN